MPYQNPYVKLRPKTRRPYTVVYLIRHCHPDYTKERKLGDFNMPLSSFGNEQLGFLTERLAKLKINRIYSSELKRAQETAAPIANILKLKIEIDSRLNEIDWWDWYRIPYFNTSEARRPKKLKNYLELDAQLDSMQADARRLLHEIFKNNRGQTIALFTHGNFIKALLTGILNADVIGFLSQEIFQSSLSKIVIDRDGYVRLNFINNVDHLPQPPEEDLFITLAD
ncbi:MAG: histidine phosphatase family protein [Candidatus Falkowbacteria bacterium]